MPLFGNAQVGVEEKEPEGLAQTAAPRHHQQREEEADVIGKWAVGRIMRQLSSIYGYAMIGAGISALFVMAVSSMEFTIWAVDGKTGSTIGLTANGSLSNISFSPGKVAVERPEPNMWLWRLGYVCYGVWLFTLAARVTFAVASKGPEPLGGAKWKGWKHAPVCFYSMLLCSAVSITFVYALPTAFGANLEYYYLDNVGSIFCAVVCVVITALILQHVERRHRARHAGPQALNRVDINRDEVQGDQAPRSSVEEGLNWANNFMVASLVFACEWLL